MGGINWNINQIIQEKKKGILFSNELFVTLFVLNSFLKGNKFSSNSYFGYAINIISTWIMIHADINSTIYISNIIKFNFIDSINIILKIC